MSVSDPVFALPQDVSLQFFLLLDENNLAKCCQVSKAWNTFVSDDKVWQEKAGVQWNRLPRAIKAMYCYESLQEKSKKHVVKLLPKMLLSNYEIIYRIHRFIHKVSLGQNGIFRCFVPSREGRVQNIVVEIRSNRTNPHDVDVSENYFTYSLAEGLLDHPVLTNEHSRSIDRIKLKYGYRFVKIEGWGVPYEIDNRIMTYISYSTYFNNYCPPKIFLIFPVFPENNFNVRTRMEYKIENMIKSKLDRFETENYYQKTRKFKKILVSIPNVIATALSSASRDKKSARFSSSAITHRRIHSQ